MELQIQKRKRINQEQKRKRLDQPRQANASAPGKSFFDFRGAEQLTKEKWHFIFHSRG